MKKTHQYSIKEDFVSEFVYSEHLYLKRLCGMGMASGGNGGEPIQSKGLLFLNTDNGRYEADKLEVIKACFLHNEIEIVWVTTDRRIHVESRWTFCGKTGVWSRKDAVYNKSDEDITLYSAVYRYAFESGKYETYSQCSKWNNENQGAWQPLCCGKQMFSCHGGRTCHGATPYLCIKHIGDKDGVAFHVIPNGNWVIRVSNEVMGSEDPLAVVELGLSDQNLRYQLKTGEKLELPQILIHHIPEGEPHLSAPILHEYVLKKLFANALPYAPVAYNTWFYDFDNIEIDKIRKQLAAAKEVGCEVFVVDAGWFGTGPGWWNESGHWVEKTDASFYGKMKDFAHEVRSHGLGFGLWMEPERVGKETPAAKAHPNWFRDSGNGFLYPDLTNPEAYAYIKGEIKRLIDTYNLVWMKIDYNFNFGFDETGMEFYSYYTQWYGMLEELKTEYPHMFFEGCASGGQRSDLNTTSVFHCHFLSDTVDPIDVIRIGEGALLRLPPGYIGKWAVMRGAGRIVRNYDSPYGELPDRVVASFDAVWNHLFTASPGFVMKAAMLGMLSISSDIVNLPDSAKQEIKKHIALYKKYRAFITRAAANLLTPPMPRQNRTGWSAVQLQKLQDTSSLMFVYKLEDYSGTKRFKLKNLNPDLKYTVKNIENEESIVSATGVELMNVGFDVDIKGMFEAVILEISVC
jgi:alpha-galactosidase